MADSHIPDEGQIIDLDTKVRIKCLAVISIKWIQAGNTYFIETGYRMVINNCKINPIECSDFKDIQLFRLQALCDQLPSHHILNGRGKAANASLLQMQRSPSYIIDICRFYPFNPKYRFGKITQ